MLNKNKMNFRFFACVAMCVVMMFGTGSCKKDVKTEEKDPREEFAGTYNARYSFVFDSQQYFSDYTLIITKSATNVNDVLMSMISPTLTLLKQTNTVTARGTVSGNALTIPQQTFVALGISGSGTLNGHSLTFSTMETHTDLTGVINVSHTATKQ